MKKQKINYNSNNKKKNKTELKENFFPCQGVISVLQSQT